MSPWCQCLNKWANRSSSILQALSALSSQLVVANRALLCSRYRLSSKVSYSSSWLSSRHLRLNKWRNRRHRSRNRKGTSSYRNYSTASTASFSSMLSDRSFNSSSSCLEGSATLCHRAHSMLPTISHPQSHSSIMVTTRVLHKSICLSSNSRSMSSSNKWAQQSKETDKTNKTDNSSCRSSIKSNSNWVSSSADPDHTRANRIELISLPSLWHNNACSSINSFPEHPKTVKANHSRICTEPSSK